MLGEGSLVGGISPLRAAGETRLVCSEQQDGGLLGGIGPRPRLGQHQEAIGLGQTEQGKEVTRRPDGDGGRALSIACASQVNGQAGGCFVAGALLLDPGGYAGIEFCPAFGRQVLKQDGLGKGIRQAPAARGDRQQALRQQSVGSLGNGGIAKTEPLSEPRETLGAAGNGQGLGHLPGRIGQACQPPAPQIVECCRQRLGGHTCEHGNPVCKRDAAFKDGNLEHGSRDPRQSARSGVKRGDQGGASRRNGGVDRRSGAVRQFGPIGPGLVRKRLQAQRPGDHRPDLGDR